MNSKSRVSFQSVHRTKLVDDVVIQLQQKITGGELKEGDKIPTEPELMEQFGVGRSTVREAVRVLVHAGLLEKKQGFGTYLASSVQIIREPLEHRLRRAEIFEVYEVRRMLELEIARLAAMRRDEDDLALMRSYLEQRSEALEAGDREGYLNADIQFHIAVAAASKNHVVIDLYRTFSSVLRNALGKLEMEEDGHDPNTECHNRLYEAIKTKDVQAAEHWTLQNLNGTVSQLRERDENGN
ncbi:transcriptional regulator [Paenibacillus oryzae]|uniref:Transcriptional regulator n=1 Tax=Paenibacillus oryzae TaxID=1844972 RepID=A0A1A5YJR8_9BACL|nr:FadR/GntR family transcriptional regulator [Paenibacillus oryzae]OBR65635.1 transcriptional regulator [Paenibacillus oryzae]